MSFPQELIDKIFIEYKLPQKIIKDNHCICSDYIIKCTEFDNYKDAIKHNNLENMNWLMKNGYPWNNWIFTYAAHCGNVEIMKWLKDNNFPNDNIWTYIYAIKLGNLKIIQWLLENGDSRYTGILKKKLGNLL